MKRVTSQPILPQAGFEGALIRLLREYSDSINQAADHKLSEFVSITGSYTAGENDHIIKCAPSAPMIVTLPSAASMRNKRIVVKRTNDTTHIVTIQSTSGDIDNAATTLLTTAYQSKELFSDGTAWWLLDGCCNNPSGGTFSAIGDLVADAAEIAGTASHFTLHNASMTASISASSAQVSGTATHIAEIGADALWDSTDQTGVWSLTNSDQTAEVVSGTSLRSVLGVGARSSGKRYLEIVFDSGGSFGVGVRHDVGVTASRPVDSGASGVNTGAGYRRAGAIFSAGSNVGTVTALSAGDVVGVAADLDTGNIWFSYNGTWTQGDPGSATSPEATLPTSTTYYPFATAEAGAAMVVTLRALNADFGYSIPTGFSSWATS